jgi:DNA helicase-2/ATP-dependent DNA helicase PcrA
MTDFEQRYVTARKAVIARDLARLNPMQRQGAMTTETVGSRVSFRLRKAF